MTCTVAKLSADGLPAASRPYKEQLWEARAVPGDSFTIRDKSSGTKKIKYNGKGMARHFS